MTRRKFADGMFVENRSCCKSSIGTRYTRLTSELLHHTSYILDPAVDPSWDCLLVLSLCLEWREPEWRKITVFSATL
jgi:hypothetical protein